MDGQQKEEEGRCELGQEKKSMAHAYRDLEANTKLTTSPVKPFYLFYCPQIRHFILISNELDCVLIGSGPNDWTTISIKGCLRERGGGSLGSLREGDGGRIWVLDDCSGYEKIFKPAHLYPNAAAYLLTVDAKKMQLEELSFSKELYTQIGIPEDYLKQINLANIPDTKQEVQDQLNLEEKLLKLEKRESGIEKIANAKRSLNLVENIIVSLEPANKFQESIKEIMQRLEQLEASNTKEINEAKELLEQLKVRSTKRINEARKLLEQ